MSHGRAPDDLVIRQLTEADSLEDLTELLHRAYRVLADQGLRFLATHQTVDVTRDRIRDGICFVGEHGGAIVGTITYYPPGYGKGSAFLERCDVAHMGQMGVAPEYRGCGVATRLIEQAEAQARLDGAVEMALDTAEPAVQLIAWYQRLGYRIVERIKWDVTNYASVVMSKKL